MKYEEMAGVATGERSESIGKRVGEAREIGAKRLSGTGRLMNAEMNPKDVDRFCKTDRDAESLLRHAHDRLQLSGRGFHRVLKVARTIADLDGASGSESRIWARLCNIARGRRIDEYFPVVADLILRPATLLAELPIRRGIVLDQGSA